MALNPLFKPNFVKDLLFPFCSQESKDLAKKHNLLDTKKHFPKNLRSGKSRMDPSKKTRITLEDVQRVVSGVSDMIKEIKESLKSLETKDMKLILYCDEETPFCDENGNEMASEFTDFIKKQSKLLKNMLKSLE
jgi:hypothetical protein